MSDLTQRLEHVYRDDHNSGDLASGGQMPTASARRFLEQPLQRSAIFGMAGIEESESKSKLLPKLTPPASVAKPGVEGNALSAADRTAVVPDQVQIDTVNIQAEHQFNDEWLEENVETEQGRNHVIDYLGRIFSNDLENLLINGDTTSADPLLALQDGLLNRFTSVTVDHNSALPSKAMFSKAERALSKAFARVPGSIHFLGTRAVSQWREQIADRMTNVGDAAFSSGVNYEATGNGRRVVDVDFMPDTDGASSNLTQMISTWPENIRMLFFKRVRAKFYEEVRAHKTGVVMQTRWGSNVEWVAGGCKTTNIYAIDV